MTRSLVPFDRLSGWRQGDLTCHVRPRRQRPSSEGAWRRMDGPHRTLQPVSILGRRNTWRQPPCHPRDIVVALYVIGPAALPQSVPGQSSTCSALCNAAVMGRPLEYTAVIEFLVMSNRPNITLDDAGGSLVQLLETKSYCTTEFCNQSGLISYRGSASDRTNLFLYSRKTTYKGAHTQIPAVV